MRRFFGLFRDLNLQGCSDCEMPDGACVCPVHFMEAKKHLHTAEVITAPEPKMSSA
jgi:hypothetical protein